MFKIFNFNKSIPVPTDVHKGLMSNSLCRGVRLGTKIDVPKDTTCFVNYKDKTYKVLEHGTYTLNDSLLQDLYEKQSKGRKIKKLNIDFFFVNKRRVTISSKFKDRIPVNKRMTIFNVNISTTITVYNPEILAKFMLRDVATITAEQSTQLFSDYIEIFTRNYLLKVNLTNYELPNDVINTYRDKLTKYLHKMGVTLIELGVSIGSRNAPEKTNFFNHLDIIDSKEKANSNSPTTVINGESGKYCTNCNIKLIDGSIFCHRCGQIIKVSQTSEQGENDEKIQED